MCLSYTFTQTVNTNSNTVCQQVNKHACTHNNFHANLVCKITLQGSFPYYRVIKNYQINIKPCYHLSCINFASCITITQHNIAQKSSVTQNANCSLWGFYKSSCSCRYSSISMSCIVVLVFHTTLPALRERQQMIPMN